MIELPQSPNYDKNVARVVEDVACCVVCGKEIGWHSYVIRLYQDKYVITSDEMLNLKDDCGYYSVGAWCVRKHPELKPYVERE